MDYLQQYAYLRHREDLRLDVMARCLVQCQAQGWEIPPWWQTLYICCWHGHDKAVGTIKSEHGFAEFTHLNTEGRLVHTARVTTTDHENLDREVARLIEFLERVAIVGTEPAE